MKISVLAGWLSLAAAVVGAQAVQTPSTSIEPGSQGTANEPDFTLVVQGHFDAETLAAFRYRTLGYAELRRRAEEGLKPLVVTDNADAIERFEQTLASRLRRARSSRRGQVFTRQMARQIRRMLRTQADPITRGIIEEDGPQELDVDVNDTYSKKQALSTVPVKILLLLPDLPPDIEYRFVGRHMILRDVRSNTIIDEIPHALPRLQP